MYGVKETEGTMEKSQVVDRGGCAAGYPAASRQLWQHGRSTARSTATPLLAGAPVESTGSIHRTTQSGHKPDLS